MWSRSGYQSGNRDVAENYESEEVLEPGDVVCLHPGADMVVRSTIVRIARHRDCVEQPGRQTRRGSQSAAWPCLPVALCGRVPCKVTDENGPIRRGDLLTSGATAGHAIKAALMMIDGQLVHRPGTVIGKALEPLASGSGIIEVFVFSS